MPLTVVARSASWLGPRSGDADAIIRLAAERVADADRGPPLELALLLSDQHAAVPDLLRMAAKTDPLRAGSAKEQKWMYLLLRALHQAQDRLTEPLATMEQRLQV